MSSSFFPPPPSSSPSYKPQIRQEGFHPDGSTTPPTTTTTSFDLFNPFLPETFRKFPSGPSPSMDFSDELVSLISNDRDERFHRSTHNIFDISAPSGAHHHQQQQQQQHDYPPPHFNQTLPAVNSSLRYENDQQQQQQQQQQQNQQPPPSSFHHFTRHTPSPIAGHGHPHHNSRSRSRSRPPSAGGVNTGGASTSGSIGPARTTRARRNNSISGASPPPGRPHAIVIPRSRAATVAGNAPTGAGNGWYIPSHSAASEYSLPTPDSLTSQHSHSHSLSSPHISHHHQSPSLSASNPATHHHHLQQQQQQQQAAAAAAAYSPFSLSPPPDSNGLHLPPVSALHSLHHPTSYMHSGHPMSGSPHSLPNIHTNLAIPTIPTIPSERTPNSAATTGHHNHSNSTSSVGNVPSNSPSGITDKQAILANEKRRRRRESHNAVERRRRDNINEKISELATLIPECLLDVTGPPLGQGGNPLATSASPTNTHAPVVGTPTDDPSSPLEWKKDPSILADAASNSGGGTPEASSNPPAVGASGPPGPVAVAVAAGGGQSQSQSQTSEGMGIVKANKGMILRKSVEYIRYLQQLVEAQGARNRELEAELKQWRSGVAVVGGSSGQGQDAQEGSGGVEGPGGLPGVGTDNDAGNHDGSGHMDLRMGGMMGYGGPPGPATYGSPSSTSGGASGTAFYGLPRLPEGEGEGDEDEEDGDLHQHQHGRRMGDGERMGEGDVMDVEDVEGGRGRTRGVNGVGKVGGVGVGTRKKIPVKEELGQGEDMMVL